MAQLFMARLDNYVLNILDISDTLNASIVRHEFVNTSGAYIQHLGNHPREIKFRAYFFGDKELKATQWIAPSYTNHFQFLNDMTDGLSSHTLIHPKYGTLDGYIENLTTIHDDTQDYVTIDLTFVQKDIQTTGFVPVNTLTKVQQMKAAALTAALNAAGKTTALLGLSNVVLDFSKSISSQVGTVTQAARSFCNQVDSVLRSVDTLSNSITSPINSLDADVAYVQDIPSRIGTSINNAMNRFVQLQTDLNTAPNAFINNMVYQGQGMMAGVAAGTYQSFMVTQIGIITATNILTQGSILLGMDDDNRTVELARENNASFNAAGDRINEATYNPYMSSNDLERFMFQSRGYIQLIIENNRELSFELARQTELLQQFVDTIKVNRLSVKTITVNNIPIHQLCLQLGLPYNAADRIIALNPQIKNPTFIEGQIQVYVS